MSDMRMSKASNVLRVAIQPYLKDGVSDALISQVCHQAAKDMSDVVDAENVTTILAGHMDLTGVPDEILTEPVFLAYSILIDSGYKATKGTLIGDGLSKLALSVGERLDGLAVSQRRTSLEGIEEDASLLLLRGGREWDGVHKRVQRSMVLVARLVRQLDLDPRLISDGALMKIRTFVELHGVGSINLIENLRAQVLKTPAEEAEAILKVKEYKWKYKGHKKDSLMFEGRVTKTGERVDASQSLEYNECALLVHEAGYELQELNDNQVQSVISWVRFEGYGNTDKSELHQLLKDLKE